MFNFYVNQHVFYALATADTVPLIEALEATRIRFPTSQWAQFLRNHDELDLGRLSEEQRKLVFDRFGPEHGNAAVRQGHPAAARPDAREPAADGARLQSDVLASRARR